MSSDLATQIAVDKIGENHFVSRVFPERTGNVLPIAYGGCTIGVAVNAACRTVADGLHAYSVLGSFLGPATVDRLVYCRINRLRDTRTFATRQVTVYQVHNDGSERLCAQLSVDFQVEETALLAYHKPPSTAYGADPYDEELALTTSGVLDNFVEKGLITSDIAVRHRDNFKLMETHFETRHSVKSISAQNAFGLAKIAKITQDQRPIYDRTCAEWIRARTRLSSYEENLAALVFLLDGALTFLPLHLNYMNLSDSAACSTLDFALRIVNPKIELEKWHFRERSTIAAYAARTYSEQRLWTRDGQIVAIMSQTCILRPKTLRQTKENARI